MGMSVKVPQPAIGRLSTYLQCLRNLGAEGKETVSSAEMESRTGINAAQFRKDLSYFGEFGTPGLGYAVVTLKQHLLHIMGLDREQLVLLVGAGNLGMALSGYPGFKQRGFRIAAVFDNNFNKIGRKLWDLEIQDLDLMARVNETLGAQVGLMAVPAASAQMVADRLVAAGIRAILNFTPERVSVREGVTVRNVELSRELEVLSYYLNKTE